MNRLDEFRALLKSHGLKPEYNDRGFSSGTLAVRNGDRPVDVVESLARTRPEMFSGRLARKRQTQRLRLG
jgi:hypothetical protein